MDFHELRSLCYKEDIETLRKNLSYYILCDYGWHLLRYSSEVGKLKTIKLLVEMGVDIHQYEESALYWACRNRHLNVIEYLISQGSDIYKDNNLNLSVAVVGKALKVRNMLIDVDKGKKWKCYECIVRSSCNELCESYKK